MIAPLDPDALVLETERLTLRPYAVEDEDIARAVLCDPEVTRYVCDPMTSEAVRAAMPRVTRRGAGGRIGMWCAIRRDTGDKIGDGVLTPLPVDSDETEWETLSPDAYPEGPVEVGYMLRRTAWGQGFASEICGALLDFAFRHTSLETVMACTDPGNAASQRVLAKCGLRVTGTGRAYGEELPIFAITRADWRAGQGAPRA